MKFPAFFVFVIIVVFVSGYELATGCHQKKANTQLDSAEAVLKKRSFYKDKNTYRTKFYSYYNQAIKVEDYDKAKAIVAAYGCVSYGTYDSVYLTVADEFVGKNYPVTIDSQYAMICHFASWGYFLNSDYPNVIKWGKKALSFCTFPNAQNTRGFALSDLAGVFVNTNQVDSAITYFMEEKEINEKRNDTLATAVSNFNIGSCYFALFAFEQCKIYVKTSAALHLSVRDTSSWLQALAFFPLNADAFHLDTANTIADIDDINAKYASYKSLTVNDTFYNNLLFSLKYLLQKDYDQGTVYLNKCKEIKSKVVDYELETYLSEYDAQYEFARTGTVHNAKDLQANAIESIKNKQFNEAINLYTILTKIAKTKNNINAQLSYRIAIDSLKDLIYLNNTQGQIIDIDKKYESAKKEQEIILQKNEIQSKEHFIAALVASLAGLLLAIATYSLWQKQRKLQREKQQTQQFTKLLLDKTEDERKRIASDLHDSISHELLDLKTANKNEADVVNKKIDDIINHIRIISRNLHPIMFDKVGLQNTTEQMVERVQQQNNFMLTCEINYQNSLPLESELQVYRMLQETVTNMVKYSNAIAGKIMIEQQAHGVNIEVKDNGVGFDVDEMINNGKSFGLHNIVERSKAIGGKASIVSGSSGTFINIFIPKQHL